MLGEGGNFNTLYESKGNNLSTNTRKELKVTGAQKWGTEGYKEEKTSQSEKHKFLNTTSVSNTNAGITQSGNTNKNSHYVAVSGNSSSGNYYSSSNSSYAKKQEEKYPPNTREKKKLMSELFGVLTIDSTWNTSSSNNNNNNLFESKNNSNRITVEVCSVE